MCGAAVLEDPGSLSSTHMAAQPSVIPVPGNLMPSSGFGEHWSYTWSIYIEAQNIYTHKINKIHPVFKKNKFVVVETDGNYL